MRWGEVSSIVCCSINNRSEKPKAEAGMFKRFLKKNKEENRTIIA